MHQRRCIQLYVRRCKIMLYQNSMHLKGLIIILSTIIPNCQIMMQSIALETTDPPPFSSVVV